MDLSTITDEREQTRRYAVYQTLGLLAVQDSKTGRLHTLFRTSRFGVVTINRHDYPWTLLDAQHLVDYLNERTSS